MRAVTSSWRDAVVAGGSLIADDFTLRLPNIRSLFEPRPGWSLLEGDFKGADAQVAAWDAGATDLKAQLQSGFDLHSENAQLLYGTKWDGRRFVKFRDIAPRAMHINMMPYRDNAKRWVHGTNFGGRENTLAAVLSLPTDHVAACQHWWREVRHPQLGVWHRDIEERLRRKMPIITNAFGYRRVYVGGAPYGRSNGNLLGQALAWICQSSVAIAINRAIERIDCNLDLIGRERCGSCLACQDFPIELLLQIHDSALMQVPTSELDALAPLVRAAMDVVVPYPDPLHIPIELKASNDNWGAMKTWKAAA